MPTNPEGVETPAPEPDVIINQNGLLYNQTQGYLCGIAPIAISKATGLEPDRKVIAAVFRRDTDFHLTIDLTIDYFNPDGSHFLTSELAKTTDDKKRAELSQIFRPATRSRTTRDSWLDPATGSTRTATGEPVTKENTPAAVPELSWFQSLNAASLAQMGINVAGMSYELIDYVVTIALIQQMDSRGQL